MNARTGLTRSVSVVRGRESSHPAIFWEGAIPVLLRAAGLSAALVAAASLVVMAAGRALG